MHKLSKRSVAAILRSGGARYRAAAAPLSSLNVLNNPPVYYHKTLIFPIFISQYLIFLKYVLINLIKF